MSTAATPRQQDGGAGIPRRPTNRRAGPASFTPGRPWDRTPGHVEKRSTPGAYPWCSRARRGKRARQSGRAQCRRLRKGPAMDVNGKVAVVTGGASGIGLALCTRFAKEGARVVLSDLDQEACNRHAAPIGALPVAADVGREDDIRNLVAATI